MVEVIKKPTFAVSLCTTILALALSWYIFSAVRAWLSSYLDKQSCSADLPDAAKTYDIAHAMQSMSLPDYILNSDTSSMKPLGIGMSAPKPALVYGACTSDDVTVAIRLNDKYLTMQPDGKSARFENNIKDPASCWYVQKPGICKQPEYNTFSSAAYPGRYLNHTDISDGAKLTVAMDRYSGARTFADYCWSKY